MNGWTPDTPQKACAALLAWLPPRLSATALEWLHARLANIASDADLFTAFALVPRKLGKADLRLTEGELAQAEAARPGWNPRAATVDQAARTLLLLQTAPDEQTFLRRLEKLCLTADVGEQVTLYRGLPLYPAPETLVARATEALRSNIRSVFEAVAHDNPFPAEYFDEGAWNQMVLKALYIGCTLHPIIGLDRRANSALAGMLTRSAHERWAAGRAVAPELWRGVGPFVDDAAIADLTRVLATGTALERQAAALALRSNPLPSAQALLAAHPDLAGDFTWAEVHRRSLES